MKLNTAPVTRSQPPQSNRPALTRSVRAARKVSHRACDQADEGRGQQPRRLGTHRRPNKPTDAGAAAEEEVHAAAETMAGTTAAGAGTTASLPAIRSNAVVAQRELQQAVVGGAGDVGPRVSGPTD